MKPRFALVLSFDGIALLHRVAGGWRLVGDASLDAPDLAGLLAGLRESAEALEPGAVTTKLVIPNEQIRYLSVETGAAGAADRRLAARAALDGATPYAVDDLVIDFAADGETTHVAAVARETLDEAEAFARDNGFNPVSFVAVPHDHTFPGEPFFGTVAGGDTVAPDHESIVVIAAADTPATPRDVEREPVPGDAVAGFAEAPPPALTPDPVTARPEPEPAPLPRSEATAPRFATRRRGETEGGPVLRPIEPPQPEPPRPVVTPPDLTPPDSSGADSTGPDLTGPEPTFPIPDAPRSDPAPPELRPERTTAPPPPRPIPASPIVPPPDPDADEAERLTIFGAREAARQRGKPRFLGLILTVGLLVALAAVAAWAMLTREDAIVTGRSDVTEPASLSGPSIIAPASVGEAPQVATPGTPQTDDAPTAADTASETVLASLPRDLDALPSRSPVDQAPRLAEPEQAAPTDPDDVILPVWADAPSTPTVPALIDLDSIYLSAIDRTDLSQDALALTAPTEDAPDPAPVIVTRPAPPGAVFDLDERGLVTASVEGTLNPDGVTVFLGRPTIAPPPTPDRPDAAGATAEDLAAEAEAAAQASAADARLAGFRPRLRPDDLAERTERVLLGGLTLEELAQRRPRLRPESVQAQAEAAAAAAAAVADAEAETEDPPSAQAIAQSPTPRLRPERFARLRAVPQDPARTAGSAVAPASSAASAPSQPARSASAAAPILQDRGAGAGIAVIQPRTVRPPAQTAPVVAREATVKNAINLRDLNLIGVYGTTADRRALVRLPSGRYRNVKVGDALDGGRIVAIGDSELRYQKGGRAVTLKMPRG